MSRDDILESITALIEASHFPPIMTEQQVSDMTGISVSWYRQARLRGDGPPTLHVGARIVRYDRETVMAWFRGHEVARG
jgi:predicted DNA-binding transcriptional regulator AlpA